MVALAGVFWSFSGVLGKFTPWNALSLVGFRGLIAMLFLGLIRRSFRPRNTLGNWMGAVGVLGTCILFMFANKLTTSANAIVLQYAMTVVVIVVESVIYHTKPRQLDVIAAALVMAGVVLCFCQGMGEGRFLGDTLALASAATYALVFLMAHMPGVDAMSYAFQGNMLCSVFLVCLPFDEGVAGGGVTGWLAAIVMGMCLGLGYFCFSKGMSTGLSPTIASITANIEPVLNPIWVLLFLGESPGKLSIAGAAIVLATITFYSIRKS